jgi:predicted nucleic acid-binding protein
VAVIPRLYEIAKLLVPAHSAIVDTDEQIEGDALESYLHASAFQAWLLHKTLVIWCQVSFSKMVTALVNSLARTLSVKHRRKIFRYEVPEPPPKQRISSRFRIIRIDSDHEPSIRPPADVSSLIAMFRNIIGQILLDTPQQSFLAGTTFHELAEVSSIVSNEATVTMSQTELLEKLLQVLHYLIALQQDTEVVVLVSQIHHLGEDLAEAFVDAMERLQITRYRNLSVLLCGAPELSLLSRLPGSWQIDEDTEYRGQ